MVKVKSVFLNALTVAILMGNSSLTCFAMSCNGSAELCTLKYNEVSFPASHNAQSYIPNWLLFVLPGNNIHNQQLRISQQLERGIRAMKLPVHSRKDKDGEKAYVCHGMNRVVRSRLRQNLCGRMSFFQDRCKKYVDALDPCFLDPAQLALNEVLSQIKEFLDQNEEEVVTLFLEDFSNDLSSVVKPFEASKTAAYLHHQDPTSEWPTLEELIKKNHRLIVFMSQPLEANQEVIEKNGFFNSTRLFVHSTAFSFASVHDLTIDQPRESDSLWAKQLARPGVIQNKLWVLQHFVTPMLAGNPEMAAEVNQAPIIHSRLNRYLKTLGVKPNFIWVDFFDLPNHQPGVIDVVRKLNQEAFRTPASIQPKKKK